MFSPNLARWLCMCLNKGSSLCTDQIAIIDRVSASVDCTSVEEIEFGLA